MIKNLRMLREEKGLSQQKLAEMLNTTQQSIFKYEKTASEPDIETLIRMADVFEVSVDFLIGNTDVRDKNTHGEAFILTEEEIEHIKAWRALPKEVRAIADKTINIAKAAKWE